MDSFQGLDWGTYVYFRYQANHAPLLTVLMEIGDGLGTLWGVAALTLLAVAASRFWGSARKAGVVLAATVSAFILVEGIQRALPRSRPPDAQNYLGADGMSSSYPSRAVFLTACAALLAAYALEPLCKKPLALVGLYALAGIAIIWVTVSQLWLGLHFLTDVLAALAGGIGTALLGRLAAERIPNST